MKFRDSTLKGTIFAILSAISGSYLFIFSKKALFSISPYLFCFYYYLFSSLFFTIFLSFKRDIKKGIFEFKRNLKVFLTVGFLELFSVILLFWAVKIGNPTVVSFINNSQMLFIIFFSYIFLGERLNKYEIRGGMLIIVGLFAITYKTEGITLKSAILTLFSILLFSITVIIIRSLSKREKPVYFAYFRSIFIFISFLLYLLIFSKFKIPGINTLEFVLLGSVFGPFLNILFYFKALKYSKASRVSLIRAGQPIFVFLNSLILLGLTPTIKETSGGLIIILGLIFLITGKSQK